MNLKHFCILITSAVLLQSVNVNFDIDKSYAMSKRENASSVQTKRDPACMKANFPVKIGDIVFKTPGIIQISPRNAPKNPSGVISGDNLRRPDICYKHQDPPIVADNIVITPYKFALPPEHADLYRPFSISIAAHTKRKTFDTIVREALASKELTLQDLPIENGFYVLDSEMSAEIPKLFKVYTPVDASFTTSSGTPISHMCGTVACIVRYEEDGVLYGAGYWLNGGGVGQWDKDFQTWKKSIRYLQQYVDLLKVQ